ncbi:MAG: LysM peptidoglycan-binding domain-containing protein [Candidatus Omnitrophica bacterium]|nr:LysM peptidoglycan-binding domain-containing protein [Candidatus Omnitrophota bacterium]
MRRLYVLNYMLVAILILSFVLSGCVVRSFPVTKERIDQDLTTGNRGYLTGVAPAVPERKTTRQTHVIEMELHSPFKFERYPKQIAKPSVEMEPETESASPIEIAKVVSTPQEVYFKKYTVQKDDTLQKISQKFFGTTKKWMKIYEANRDILKGPDKIYPGQVINIPMERLKESSGNLK